MALVRYRTNDYSVPVEWGHREVLVKGFVHEVVICAASEVIVALLGAAFYANAINEALWLGVHRLGPATFHPLTLIYALSGSAMISATFRVPKP
jgi:hypothetical protein